MTGSLVRKAARPARRAAFAWAAAAVLLLACAPPASARSRALLIGISQYADPEMNDLAYADEDVKTFGSILKNFADYRESDLDTLYNSEATKQRIVSSLLEIVKASQKEPLEHFILMYAGHGLPSTIETRKTNSFLAPHDAYLNQFFPEGTGDMLGNETFINKAWLVRQLSSMNAKNIVIILDSCYSGAKDFGALYAENLGFKTEFVAGGDNKRNIVVVRKKGADGKVEKAIERRIAFLASSRENQPSAEYAELKHGALSYTIFEYLNAVRKETESAEQKGVTVDGMYTGISGLFDTVKVKGGQLSKMHQPVLFAIPSYDDVKDMQVVSVRGVKISAPKLIAMKTPEPPVSGSHGEDEAAPPPPPSPPPAPPEKRTGTVYLDTGDEDCEVVLDGVKTGRFANGDFELAEGKHLVSLYLRKTRYNRTVVVDVKSGSQERVQVGLWGELEVASVPGKPGESAPALDVYLDGKSVGKTGLSLKNVVAGTHTLTVVIDKIEKTRKVEIRPESPLLVRYKIIRKPAAKRDANGADNVTF